MDYGDIVTRSWRIVWNNKFLWVLGFLGAFTRASGNFGGGSNSSTSTPTAPEDWGSIAAIIAISVCALIVVAIIIWLVGLAARGGLITAVARIDNGEKSSLRQSFRDGFARLNSLVGMNFLLYLPILIIVVLMIGGSVLTLIGSGVTAGTMADSNDFGAVVAGIGMFAVCFFFLMCVAVILGIVLNFINAFAFRGIMLQELGAMESIKHGWHVFRENMAEALVLAMLFFGIGIIYGMAVFMLTMPLLILMFVPLLGTLFTGGEPGVGSIAFLAGGGICLGVFAAGLYSILISWQSAAFTLAYQEFVSKPGEKFEHFAPVMPKEPEDIDDGPRPDFATE